MKDSEVEQLAYWLWQWRGRPWGSPDQDWFLAETLLEHCRRFEISLDEMPLYAFGIERQVT